MAAGPPRFIVNFHGIGSPDRPWETGESGYWLSGDLYRKVLDALAAHPRKAQFSITFDDGNASDIRIAVPALLERGLTATIFALAGKTDHPGYLTAADLRELVKLGFRVGTHGVNHVRWDRLKQAELDVEIDSSRAILEDILGIPVTAVALPFGGYNHRVLKTLGARGLREIYSSDGGPRWSSMAPIPRLSALHDINPNLFIGRIENAIRLSSRLFTETRILVKGVRP